MESRQGPGTGMLHPDIPLRIEGRHLLKAPVSPRIIYCKNTNDLKTRSSFLTSRFRHPGHTQISHPQTSLFFFRNLLHKRSREHTLCILALCLTGTSVNSQLKYIILSTFYWSQKGKLIGRYVKEALQHGGITIKTAQSHCIARHVEKSDLQLRRITSDLPSSQDIVLAESRTSPKIFVSKERHPVPKKG